LQVRRTTLMVAFWRDLTVRPGPEGKPGPSRPFPQPGTSRAFTWNDSFDLARAAEGGTEGQQGQGESKRGRRRGEGRGAAAASPGAGALAERAAAALGLGQGEAPAAVAAQPVAPIWQDVDEPANRAAGCALSGLSGLPDYQLCFQGF
jgi:hypothetical protein